MTTFITFKQSSRNHMIRQILTSICRLADDIIKISYHIKINLPNLAKITKRPNCLRRAYGRTDPNYRKAEDLRITILDCNIRHFVLIYLVEIYKIVHHQ